MVLRIDPRLSLVWRTPHTVQVGADRPDRLLEVSPGEEKLLAALRIGTTRAGLEVVARAAGVEDGVVRTLLERLGEAVLEPRPVPDLAVVVEHTGLDKAAETVASALLSAGARLVEREDPEIGFAVTLAPHVLPPGSGARWLAGDLPHLPIVFGDVEVEVGPLVLPGQTVCLACVTLRRLDEDPGWAAVATQLLSRRSAAAAESPVLVHQAVVVLLRAVAELRAGRRTGLEDRSVRVGVGGTVSDRRWTRAPHCSCRALPENGSGTRPDSPPPGVPE